jgi:leucine-zipper-like transcriptional regulator 1
MEFDFNLYKWSTVPAAGRRPRARYRATCVVHENQMILFGGHDGTRHLSDTHVFDFETRIWTSLVTDGIPPIPRDSHVSCVWNRSMYVFGGSSGSEMCDLHELQLPLKPTAPAKWRQLKSPSSDQSGARFCHVAVVYQDAMYVFGGYDGRARLNDFIRFDFEIHDIDFELPPSTLVSDLRHLVNHDTVADITFIVEDIPVHAHKLMLMRSSYFRALFLGEMQESRLSSIHIEQIRHPVFISILEYLYTDSVKIKLEEAMELFEAADRFCIPRLKIMCEKCMLQSIHVENAATIFHAADRHTATALRHKALKFMLAHFEEVSKTEAFEDMGRSNMDLVFEVLQRR